MNRMSRAKKERVAEILVDAYLTRKDAVTAKKHGISVKSLYNYRKRLDEDAELAELFREKKAVASDGWADEVPGAMRASVTFLREAAERGERADPEMVHAIAGSMKLLSEVASTWKFLELKLLNTSKPQVINAPQQTGATPLHARLPN